MRPLVVETTIASLAPGRGDGVTHVDVDGERRAVFVPHAAAGDVLRVEVDLSRRPARGRLLAVVRPGPERVAPACPWSVRCGGCDWMHLTPAAQERTHAEHLRAAFPASAGWEDVPVATSAAPAALAYRTRARVHVKVSSRGRVAVGMHEAGTRDPVEVETCAVLDPALESARRALAPIFDGSRGKGDVQIALGAARRPVIEVRWEGDLAPAAFARLEQAVAGGVLAGARVTANGATKPAKIGDPTPWMAGADGAPLRLAPGGFGQASERMNAVLARHVADLVRAVGPDRAVELYAGAGNLSVLLARDVGDLVCVEADRDACDAARANLADRGLAARVVEANADEYAVAKSARLVVLDPPRTGARAVAERLAASRVAHIVYVACDAQTLGRDLAILDPAYAPRSAATFEMFPQTSHVEAVVMLERRRP